MQVYGTWQPGIVRRAWGIGHAMRAPRSMYTEPRQPLRLQTHSLASLQFRAGHAWHVPPLSQAWSSCVAACLGSMSFNESVHCSMGWLISLQP